MIMVIHADMRALGYCNRGARSWFARHQLDWSDFIHQGIKAESLLATGDAMAEAVVMVARNRISGDTTLLNSSISSASCKADLIFTDGWR